MRNRRRQGQRKPTPSQETVTIERLGRSGDGLAGSVAVPYTLPGETVRIEKTGNVARPLEILAASPHRQTPPCPHYGLPGDGCGGCHLQHMGLAESLAWKVDRVKGALDHMDLGAPDRITTHQSPPRSRRRARLGLIRTGKGWQAGFRQWRSHRIVPMRECHILDEQLFAVVQALLSEPGRFLPVESREADLTVTLTDTGIDLDLSGIDEASLSLDARQGLADFAAAHDLARLTIDFIPMIQARAPALNLGGISVPLPTGTFLQATEAGQEALIAKVVQGVGDASRIADLFCGIGTFALPLSQSASVLAVDSDGPAITSLTSAVRQAGRSVETQKRDLFDLPLTVGELEEFDAVIIDPPRAGAEAQARELAGSGVPVVVSVSCNPDTFARDAAALAAAYDLISLHVVDQFIWSPHIEVVAKFHRRG